MKAQFKYTFRQSLELKVAAFAELAIMNLVFGILGYYSIWGEKGKIVAVTLSSIAFVGMIVVRTIVDNRYLKDIFATPDGYLYALTPVKSWKILLARVIVMVCEDCAALFVGIFGIAWQAMVLSGQIGFGVNNNNDVFIHINPEESKYLIFIAFLFLLGYAYLTMFGVFGASLKTSVFFGVRGRTLLTVIGAAAVMWVFNLLNFAAAPFGEVTRWKYFFNISLSGGFYMMFAFYFVLYSAKTAALFVASSMLMERKNNL